MQTINWPWAIVLCQFNDVPALPKAPDYYRDLFTRNGSGGVCDYWRAVTCNALDISSSRVFGWFTMNRASTEVTQLHFPNDRAKLVQWGIDTANANGVNLAQFRSVLIVQNFGVDHGAAHNGIIIVDQNATLCEFGFICHEMGHGFGLPHSFSANPDMEYGDGWDLMSFATTTFQFPIQFRGAQGAATVGLNLRNLRALVPDISEREWVPGGPDFSSPLLTLDALNQVAIGNHGPLVASIPPNATRPARQNGSTYTIEFRHKAGWDRNIPEDAVVIREVRANGLSFLQPAIWGRFNAGTQFVTPDPKVYVRVVAIDANAGTASVRIWDAPEKSVRKEDSKPKVYLIENGTKRWITSPQALAALGKTWADVRSVPDGGLATIPDGIDINLMRVGVTLLSKTGTQRRIRVSVADMSTNNPVAGARITISDSKGTTKASADTDAQGTVELDFSQCTEIVQIPGGKPPFTTVPAPCRGKAVKNGYSDAVFSTPV